MAAGPERPPKRRGGVSWMATFADLAALMLTFFVLTYSMTTTETEAWTALSDAFLARVQPGDDASVLAPFDERTMARTADPVSASTAYLAALIEAELSGNATTAPRVRIEGDIVTLDVDEAALRRLASAGRPAPDRATARLARALALAQGAGRRPDLVVTGAPDEDMAAVLGRASALARSLSRLDGVDEAGFLVRFGLPAAPRGEAGSGGGAGRPLELRWVAP